MGISLEELKKVSYLKIDKHDGRVIPLQPCFLGGINWESWLPLGNKGIFPFKMADVADSKYFSKNPAKETDVYIDFINLLIKRAYFKDLVHFEGSILEDLNNLATSATKINLFHKVWLKDENQISSRFVKTELEYIFNVCRSIFDLLQEVVSKMWARSVNLETREKTKKLKSTFSKMVLFNNKLSSAKEIEQKYNIPKLLADFYFRHGAFFTWLRSYRDKIAHGGENIRLLYILKEGFAVDTELEPFKGLHIWNHTELKNKKLGSVKSVVSYAILNTIFALEDYSAVIQSIVKLPEDIAPDYKIYIRGENLEILQYLHRYIDGGEWN